MVINRLLYSRFEDLIINTAFIANSIFESIFPCSAGISGGEAFYFAKCGILHTYIVTLLHCYEKSLKLAVYAFGDLVMGVSTSLPCS